MNEVVVIVAGGSGSRMNSELPKQFIELNGLPVLMHTISRFYNYNKNVEIRLVLPSSQLDFWKKLVEKHNFSIKHSIYEGGKTRFHSVKNGLRNLPEDSLVAIHDGVRPLVSTDTIIRGFSTARNNRTAIPVIDVHETVRYITPSGSKTVDRNSYKLVQTPQVFQSKTLLNAYDQEFVESFTDDASVVEALGQEVHLYEGNRENIKITTPNDLVVAEAYMNR